MKLVIFIFMFVMLVGLLIISNNNLSLFNFENLGKFVELFLDWIKGFG